MKQNLSLGQHFMVDEHVLERILQTAHIQSDDVVVEIGSGRGALTKHLFHAKPKELICIEKDNRLHVSLPVKQLRGDALQFIPKLSFTKVVANIPYHISEPLLIQLLLKAPKKIVLVVGKTFAEKLIGQSIIGKIFQGSYEVRLHEFIPPKAFFPPPQTTSALIEATLKPTPASKLLTPFYIHQRQKVKNYILTVTKDLWTKKEIRERMACLGGLLEKQLYQLSTKEFSKLYSFLLTLV